MFLGVPEDATGTVTAEAIAHLTSSRMANICATALATAVDIQSRSGTISFATRPLNTFAKLGLPLQIFDNHSLDDVSNGASHAVRL